MHACIGIAGTRGHSAFQKIGIPHLQREGKIKLQREGGGSDTKTHTRTVTQTRNTTWLRAQLENRAFWVRLFRVRLGCLGEVVPSEVRSSARRVRSRPPPLTPADGHCRCFWLRHRPRRAPCARRHRASNVIDRAACCVVAFLWLSSKAFCVPAGGRMCVVDVSLCASHRCG